VLASNGELLIPRDGTHLKNRFRKVLVGIDAHFRRWSPVRFSAGAVAGWNERVYGPHAEPRDSPQPRRIGRNANRDRYQYADLPRFSANQPPRNAAASQSPKSTPARPCRRR
jgi:hypothetical protein